MFKNRYPYMCLYSKAASANDHHYINSLDDKNINDTVTFDIAGFYKPVSKDLISNQRTRSFMPPLLNYKTWRGFSKVGDPTERYCPNQFTLSTQYDGFDPTSPNAESQRYLFTPLITGEPPAKSGESLIKYFTRINFTAYQVINWNGLKYITVEYVPNYAEGEKHEGSTEAPVFVPVTKWNEIMCGKYVNQMLQAKNYTWQSVEGGKPMNKHIDSTGFWNI